MLLVAARWLLVAAACHCAAGAAAAASLPLPTPTLALPTPHPRLDAAVDLRLPASLSRLTALEGLKLDGHDCGCAIWC